MYRELRADRLLREAREAAGLSQRELARRARTAQSVISRIESGRTDPSTATLQALLAAAGLSLVTELEPQTVRDTHMLDDVVRILQLTAEERLQEIRNIALFTQRARRG